MPDISGFKTDVQGAYIDKDPAATLTYTINWGDWLSDNTLLATSTFAVSTIPGDSTPLTVAASSILTNTQAAVVLSGGREGEIYTVTNTITTDAGDVDARRFKVKVRARYL